MTQNHDTDRPWYRSPAEAMAEELALQVLGGTVPPGHQLSTEQAICDRSGVSRTVAREVLQSLAAKGLIESRPRVGAIVRPEDAWNFLDSDVIRWTSMLGDECQYFEAVLEARYFLEPQIASVAARRAQPADLVEMEQALLRMEGAAAREDLDAFHEADLAFHLSILHATHNVVLRRFGELFRAAMRTGFRMAVSNRPISPESVALHRAVYEAIRDNDPETARTSLNKVAYMLEDLLGRTHADQTRATSPSQ